MRSEIVMGRIILLAVFCIQVGCSSDAENEPPAPTGSNAQNEEVTTETQSEQKSPLIATIATGLNSIGTYDVSRDGRLAIVMGYVTEGDKEFVKIIDLAKNKELHSFDVKNQSVSQVAMSRDGQKAVYVDDQENRIVVVVPVSGKELSVLAEGEKQFASLGLSPYHALEFSQDGKQIWGATDRHVRIWDADKGGDPKKILEIIEEDEEQKISAMLPIQSADATSNTLVVATTSIGLGTLELWNVSDQRMTSSLEPKPRNATILMSISPNQRFLVTEEYIGDGNVWDIVAGKHVLKLPTFSGPQAVFVSNSIIALKRRASDDPLDDPAYVLALYNIAAKQEIRRWDGHAPADGIAAPFHAIGEDRLVTPEKDGSLKLWKIDGLLDDERNKTGKDAPGE